MRVLPLCVLATLALLGCSNHFIHENGQMQTCRSFGYGKYGIPAAAIGRRLCNSDARKLGFHEFDIDGGVAGLFLADEYVKGRGIRISSVWPNSPASCANILQGQYLFKVDGHEVATWDDAYGLMDNCSSKTVQVTIIDQFEQSRVVTIEKMSPGNPYQCRGI